MNTKLLFYALLIMGLTQAHELLPHINLILTNEVMARDMGQEIETKQPIVVTYKLGSRPPVNADVPYGEKVIIPEMSQLSMFRIKLLKNPSKSADLLRHVQSLQSNEDIHRKITAGGGLEARSKTNL